MSFPRGGVPLAVRKEIDYSYGNLKALAKDRYETPVSKCIKLLRTAQGIKVQLYDTIIANVAEDGSLILSSGGVHTMTTKTYLEDILASHPRSEPYKPVAQIFCEKGFWFIGQRGLRYRFTDGIEVRADGSINSREPVKETPRGNISFSKGYPRIAQGNL